MVAARRLVLSRDELHAKVAAAKAGSREALGDVVEAVEGIVVGIAMSYARSNSGHEKDDLLQEARITVASAVRWFRPELGFRFTTFAANCVRRHLYSVVRDRRQRPLAGYECPEGEEHTGSENLPADGIMDPRSDPDREAAAEQLAEVLGRLDPLSALVVRLRHGMGRVTENPLGWQEIGRRIGTTRKAAENLYDAAIARLRGEAPAADLN